ncbi:hypothetical protein Neosp_011301 [[Neocosmospora] mangrovei]
MGLSNRIWDKVTSQETIPTNLRPSQYPATYQFDRPNEAQTSLTQSAVQEVFWVMEDCETIRRLKINARFIKLDKGRSTKHNTHSLLVVNTDEQMSEFAITLPRVTKEGSAVKLSFKGPPPPGSDARPMKTLHDHPHDGNLALKVCRSPGKWHTGWKVRGQKFQAFDTYAEGEQH